MGRRAQAMAVGAALVVAAAPLVLPPPPVAYAAPGDIVATSVTSILLGFGGEPAVSGDGRFVAFRPAAGGLAIGEPTVPGATQVAVNGQGVVADGRTTPGGMSANGRHVVLITDATNLVPTDSTARVRVYTLDRDTDDDGIYDEPGYTTIRRIPGRVAASTNAGGYARADISDDGRFVAFTQPDVDGTNTCLRAYRYDRDTDLDGVFDEPGATATIDVTVNSAGAPGARTGGCFRGIPFDPESVAISGDGQAVAFTSDFDNLVPGDANLAFDVFVRDLTTNTTIRVPTSPANVNGPNTLQAALGGISSTGRYVVVTTNANGTDYVFRHDRDSDADGIFDEPAATSNVTVSTVSYLGQTAAISGDGGTVALWSTTGIQVWRPTTGLVRVLPITLANAGGAVALNASGNVLALRTREQYDAADVNDLDDIYRVELSAGPPAALNVSVSSPASTPPAATVIPITNISPQTIRAANFDVTAAPGGGVKRAPGGGVKRAPGGGVKRAPGGGVKRAPGGGVKRADELSNFAAVFGRVPAINNLPLSSIPIVGGWEPLLPVSLQGRPLQTLTFGQVLAAIGPGTVQLEQLDLTNTPIANLSSAAFALGATPINQLLIDSSTLWCTRLTQLTTRTCASLNITNQTSLIELEMRAETRQILADFPALVRIPVRLNTSVLRAAGAPILQETFATLGLGISKVGDLPVATAIAASPGIGSLTVADIGNTALTLDCVTASCPTATTLTALQASGQVQAGARLRDFTQAISTKKLDDVVSVLPADITLNDVLIGLLEAQDFPWEAVDLVMSGIQDAASTPTSVNYTVGVTATGGIGPFDGNVEVVLPAGWRIVPGTSSVSPAIALPLSEPSRTYTRTETRLGFRLTGFMPGVPLTISFQARPGFVLGTVAANATAESAGTTGSATPTPITILEPSDTSADPGTAPTLQSDRLYIAYTTAPNDVDLFRFNPPPGKVVSVWLSNFDKDADLSLYGPAPDAASAAGSPSAAATRGPGPASAPSADEGTNAVGGALIAEPQSERDVPSVAGTTLLGTSANSDVDVEGVSAVNANLIQVAPYQGATSTGPYVVRVRLDDTEAAGACTYTRTGGVQGPAFDVSALPANLETAILVNQRRLGDAMLPAQALDLITNSLIPLAGAPGVNGAIVYLDQVIDYSALDASWCSPDASNDVVRQVGTLIDHIRDERPSLRHLVIVGGDDIVPMARIDDLTRTGNEREYADELLAGNGGVTTPLTEALGTRHFLTDDPYGDLDPIAWFNRRLYVPDLAVGRLVESHDEIAAAVSAYLDPNGDGVTTDAGVMPATSTYMTGYDFMADGATKTRASLDAALAQAGGAPPASTKNISPPDAVVTKSQVLTGAALGRAVGLFGHFAHDGALTDAGFRSNSGEKLFADRTRQRTATDGHARQCSAGVQHRVPLGSQRHRRSRQLDRLRGEGAGHRSGVRGDDQLRLRRTGCGRIERIVDGRVRLATGWQLRAHRPPGRNRSRKSSVPLDRRGVRRRQAGVLLEPRSVRRVRREVARSGHVLRAADVSGGPERTTAHSSDSRGTHGGRWNRGVLDRRPEPDLLAHGDCRCQRHVLLGPWLRPSGHREPARPAALRDRRHRGRRRRRHVVRQGRAGDRSRHRDHCHDRPCRGATGARQRNERAGDRSRRHRVSERSGDDHHVQRPVGFRRRQHGVATSEAGHPPWPIPERCHGRYGRSGHPGAVWPGRHAGHVFRLARLGPADDHLHHRHARRRHCGVRGDRR